jgi:photosystem II stability/assembly factor-like uncharacterized protein
MITRSVARRGRWSVAVVAVAVVFLYGCARVVAPATEASGRSSGSTVLSMQLLTPTQGWALTDRGLMWTDDGGSTWTDVNPPDVDPADIQDVSFRNASEGWITTVGRTTAVGSTQGEGDLGQRSLAVLRTMDGGKTWTASHIELPSDATGTPSFVDLVDEENGWVVAVRESSSNFSRGALFGTRDGGATWRELPIPIGEPVRFITPSIGWVAGGAAGDELYATFDGGASWTRVTVPTPKVFGSAAPAYALPTFIDAKSGVLPVTFAGHPSGIAFYVTDDAGASWRTAATVLSPEPAQQGVEIPSDVVDALGWIAALPGGSRVFVTKDGGASWDEVAPNGLPAGIASIDFASAEIGWALVRAGRCAGFKTGCSVTSELIATTDAGQTWTTLTP